MAIAAGCGVAMPVLQRDAMDAGVVTFRLPRMADGAVDRLERDVIVGMFGGDIGVASDAGIGFVRGGGELCLIDEQRDRPAGGIRFGEGIVAVAIQAITVLQRGRVQLECCEYDQRGDGESAATHTYNVMAKATERLYFLC